MKLEIAVVSALGSGVAASEGADRIELCSSLELGGVTPSQGLMEASVEHVDGRLEIHPLIRCRPGDFHYSASDLDTMAREIRALLAQGAHGVVLGALTAGGEVDVHATRLLADAARETKAEAQLTFHRAIDQSADPLAALDQLLELGFTRVLSSGHAATAGAGAETLARMVQRAGGDLEIMAGGGLTLGDIPAMRQAGVAAVHLSAKKMVSTLAAGAISLGGQDRSDPTAYMVTDRETVRAARAAVDASNATESGTTPEFAEVTGHDVTSIICVCGNSVGGEGLIQANSEGIPVHIGDGSVVPAGLAAWPRDEAIYTLCPSCGRVYRDNTIEETGTAPVAFRVDVTAGPVAEAIRVHWDLSS